MLSSVRTVGATSHHFNLQRLYICLTVFHFMPLVTALQIGYFAAVDTLWRDIELQSIESFIQFSRALDPYSMSPDSRPLHDREGHLHCGPEQEQSRHVSEKGKTTQESACGSSRASLPASLVPFLVPENPPRPLSAKSPSCSMSSLQCSASIGTPLVHFYFALLSDSIITS